MPYPQIIKKGTLHITGLSGNGAKTGEVWNEFDRQYNQNPFPKAEESGFEVRFSDGEKPVLPGRDIHVGFSSAAPYNEKGFTTLTVPETEMAVFDILVADGYESGNEAMENWLADSAMQFGQRRLDGRKFVVECYNHKFKGGNQPDSIVEIWIPLLRFCQSCFMPMTKPEDFGTEADCSASDDYCCHCYQNGGFTWGSTLAEAVEENIQFWRKDGDTSDGEARERIKEVFPKLKRWASSEGNAK